MALADVKDEMYDLSVIVILYDHRCLPIFFTVHNLLAVSAAYYPSEMDDNKCMPSESDLSTGVVSPP